MNIQSLMMKSKDSGQLENIFKESWNLNDTPIIGEFKYHMNQSKVRTINSVDVKMKGHEINHNDNNQNNNKEIIDSKSVVSNMMMNDEGGVEMFEMINRNPTNEIGEGVNGDNNNMFINYIPPIIQQPVVITPGYDNGYIEDDSDNDDDVMPKGNLKMNSNAM